MNLDHFNLHILPQKSGSFFIYATKDEQLSVGVDHWKQQLFMWHEESFYGSFIEMTKVDGLYGVEVDSYQILTLLGHERFSSLVQWDWAEPGDALLAVAPVMLDAIHSGSWLPDFKESADTDQPFHWKVPQMVWDEFTEDYWEEPFYNEKMETFIAQFFNHAISSYLGHGLKGERLRGKFELLQQSPLTPEELAAYFDEDRWNQWIGKDDEKPFTIGLRLTEPEEDEQPWMLETILRDVKKPERLFSLKQKSRIPKRWTPFLQDVYDEQERWQKLFPWLAGEDGLTDKLDEPWAWEFLTDASGKLFALGIEILLPSWWEAMREANMAVKARVRQTNTNYRPSFVGLQAMLDFDWRLSMNGAELSEDEFQELITEQRKLVKIRGRWVKLDPKMVAHIQALMQQAKKEGLRMQDIFSMKDEAEIEEIDADEVDPRAFAKIQIELNQSMKKMMRQLSNISEIPSVPVSPELVGTLRPYQQLGLDWLVFLRQFGFGAILADDMGLGKTIQLIAYLLHVKSTEGHKEPALIVCPTSVLGNWQRELERFSPDLKVHLHYGASRDKGEDFKETMMNHDIVLTSYGLSHIDFEEFSDMEWSTIALDEAQNIKNANTKQSRAIRKLTGKHHIALTGTPMENRLTELWSIFDFVNHGYLGTVGQFQKRYIVPIERDGSEAKIKELQQLIKPFLLRRTKKDPDVELNLPDKLEQKEYCALTTEQAALYEDLVRDTFNKIDTLSHFERKGMILQMLNRLKQLCNHPALFLKEETPIDIETRSNKMGVLTELADSIVANDEGCLIFTQYIGMGEMIRSVLEERYSVSVPFLNGSMPKAKRDEYVMRFQNGEFPFFILSLKAGGTGLNLTAANHVIHYDRWWNPAVENQATDRAYRIGQNRFVHVHKLITTGTLEEKIDMMLEKKQALNDEIIRSDQWVTELSNDDLRDLLALV
ncbi:DEAD/DEAH box helicase [Pseudogracilibacillus auburnensis]|uniref:DEAD/DEAH box helicase n=1 Tax=Pseudogracilibacillus auburnensis TaxID=1494959 RepID=UPI001A9566BE|nr:DEAD/DEAH box helicase [Pseudogracilibacillus auburnensis]MBO1004759.1 DEAD/DEAH box helicase [Pseudogracilibacillus auburnensis]